MLRCTAVLCLLALALAACAPDDAAEGTSPEPSEPAPAPQANEPTEGRGRDDAGEAVQEEGARVHAGNGLEVAATVFPLAWMAEQVAPGAEVTYLGASGQDPHDMELSPADRELLETADIVAYVGDIDFQPQVEAAVGDDLDGVVDVAAVAGEARWLAFDHDDDGHDAGGDDHDGGGDGHARIDPHLWFDTGVMADVANEMARRFAEADPDHAETYEENATLVAGELRAVGDEMDEILSGCTNDTVMVSHEAYAYLLEPRGLQQEGISGAGGHGEASPQRLAELSERVRSQNIPAVATEPVEGRADAEALASESGADLVEIHPLETAEDDEFETGYPQLLLEQAEAFATALDCPYEDDR